MRVCAYVGCNNKGIHTFPSREPLKKQWIKATGIDIKRKIGWHLRKYSCLCSDHFTLSDFNIRGKRRILKKTAIPSIFPGITIHEFGAKDSSSQDHVSFNPANASKNYSRTDPPTMFVEEYPEMHIEMPGTDIDPLQTNDESDDESDNESDDESHDESDDESDDKSDNESDDISESTTEKSSIPDENASEKTIEIKQEHDEPL